MDMIWLDIHLFYVNLFPFADRSNLILQKICYDATENPKTIFGRPYNMIGTMVNAMRQLSVLDLGHKTQDTQGRLSLQP